MGCVPLLTPAGTSLFAVYNGFGNIAGRIIFQNLYGFILCVVSPVIMRQYINTKLGEKRPANGRDPFVCFAGFMQLLFGELFCQILYTVDKSNVAFDERRFS